MRTEQKDSKSLNGVNHIYGALRFGGMYAFPRFGLFSYPTFTTLLQ